MVVSFIEVSCTAILGGYVGGKYTSVSHIGQATNGNVSQLAEGAALHVPSAPV